MTTQLTSSFLSTSSTPSLKKGESIASYLMDLTYANKVIELGNFFKQNPTLNITTIVNNNNYSLLHIACKNNLAMACVLFFEHLNTQHILQQDIGKWVNLQTDEGQTAMHFASSNGNLRLINMLEAYGSNIFITDNNGLNVLHFAAFADQPISLVYFISKGINTLQRDKKGRTPLHIAAMEGMFNSTHYLIARGSELDTQDFVSHYTPLHYAVLSGNLKVVKVLLLKGANPNIRSSDGELPFDIAQKHPYYAIQQLLKKKSWLTRFLGMQFGVPTKKCHYTFTLSFVIFFFILASNLLFVFPFIHNIHWIIVFAISTSLTVFAFLLSWLKNPGFLKGRPGSDVLSLLKEHDPQYICPTCVIIKPLRSRHCEACNSCVSVYDHHCTWVNNCVGAKNHRYFLCFALLTLISMIILISMEVILYNVESPGFNYMRGVMSIDALYRAKNIVCLSSAFIGLIFTFPLIVLNFIHIKNFLTGLTTMERYGSSTRPTVREMKEKLRESMASSSGSFFEEREEESKWRECWNNCLDMSYRNARNPRYMATNLMNNDDEVIELA